MLFMAMRPTAPERISLIPQRPVARARLNYELPATSCHGNDEPNHACSFPCFLCRHGRRTRTFNLAWWSHLGPINLAHGFAVKSASHQTPSRIDPCRACSSLEFSSRRVDKTVSACVGGKTPTLEPLAFNLLHLQPRLHLPITRRTFALSLPPPSHL